MEPFNPYPPEGFVDFNRLDLIAHAYALVEQELPVPADLHTRLLEEGVDLQPFTN